MTPEQPQRFITSSVRNNGTVECENVKVAVRVRPTTIKKDIDGEIADQSLTRPIYSMDPDLKGITLIKPNTTGNIVTKSFRFDRVFDKDATQLDLYKCTAFPIVDKVMRGYNGTIFAYGQTGTGKTYTMMGKENRIEDKGIVPNAFAHIFGQIAKYNEERSFVVTATYLEIYNEDVRDLLSQKQNVKLEVRERADLGVYVKVS